MKRVFRQLWFQGTAYGMSHPKMYKTEEYRELANNLMPVYPLTKGAYSQDPDKGSEGWL